MSAGTEEWTGEPRYRVERPVMTQRWLDLTSLHWRYDPSVVAAALPPGLRVATFDGSAWVGLIPFRMADIAASFTPPIPYLGTFPETNIRTYVDGPEGPGIWFHSLDISRLLPVLVARTTYRLPYMWAKMRIDQHGSRLTYRMRRRWPGPRDVGSEVVVDVGEAIARPTALDHFLTAQWGLYTMLGRRLAHAKVEHEPWPLRRALPLLVDDQLAAAAGYPPPDGPPHVLHSPGVTVRIERPRFV